MKEIKLFGSGNFKNLRLDHTNVDPLKFDYFELVADQANSILNDWLKDAVRVYGNNDLVEPGTWSTLSFGDNTHQGLLVCIEKIKKPCSHKPKTSFYGATDCFLNECEICGIKLAPTGWKAVE